MPNTQEYTYKFADGTRSHLKAGEDGVTEKWIALLHEMDREEYNKNHRGVNRGIYYYDGIELLDESNILKDDTKSPETVVFKAPKDTVTDNLIWKKLSTEEKNILKMRNEGMLIEHIARELEIPVRTLKRRIATIKNKAREE